MLHRKDAAASQGETGMKAEGMTAKFNEFRKMKD